MSDQIADVLADAGDLIEKGWVQDQEEVWDGGKVSYCSVGALRVATKQHGQEFLATYRAAVRALAAVIPNPERGAPGTTVVHWNDTGGRTQQEVLDAFRKAEKMERA